MVSDTQMKMRKSYQMCLNPCLNGRWSLTVPCQSSCQTETYVKDCSIFVQKIVPYLEFGKIINDGFSAKMWQNYVVNFNITLNGNTSKIKSDRKYTIFFGYGQEKKLKNAKCCMFLV